MWYSLSKSKFKIESSGKTTKSKGFHGFKMIKMQSFWSSPISPSWGCRGTLSHYHLFIKSLLYRFLFRSYGPVGVHVGLDVLMKAFCGSVVSTLVCLKWWPCFMGTKLKDARAEYRANKIHGDVAGITKESFLWFTLC